MRRLKAFGFPVLAIPRDESTWLLEWGSFALEKSALRFDASLSRIPAQTAGFREDTVAGDDDAHRVPRARRSHGPARLRPPELPSNLAVRYRLSKGDRAEEFEDLAFERRDLEMQRDVPEVIVPGPDVLEDPREVRMVRTCGVGVRLLREVDARDAVAEELESNVEAELSAELRVDLECFVVGTPRTSAHDRKQCADDVMFRPVQMLFERASCDSQ